MFKGPRETEEFCRAFSPPDGVDVVIAPPFTSLREAVASGLTVYAQNVHWADEGAFTGEVSAPMLKEVGCSYVIVGHSERRQFFGETDETVNKRLQAVVKAGMRPIACVGETLAEREAGRTLEVVTRQVKGADSSENLLDQARSNTGSWGQKTTSEETFSSSRKRTRESSSRG